LCCIDFGRGKVASGGFEGSCVIFKIESSSSLLKILGSLYFLLRVADLFVAVVLCMQGYWIIAVGLEMYFCIVMAN
jgi:hypothetical protein